MVKITNVCQFPIQLVVGRSPSIHALNLRSKGSSCIEDDCVTDNVWEAAQKGMILLEKIPTDEPKPQKTKHRVITDSWEPAW